MQRVRWAYAWLAVLLVFGLVLVPTPVSLAQEAAPAAPDTVPTDDEIALIESNGMIRIVDPSQPTGILPFSWTSPDIGWGNVAAGDFNGDGDAELVAIRASTIKVFDPYTPPGSIPASFENTLSGQAYQLLATGDLDNDRRDEIVATHTATGGIVLQIWDSDATGNNWRLTRSENFSAWDGISIGDMNNDGNDDIALFRFVQNPLDNRINVYPGNTFLPPLVQQAGNAGRWITIALGNISNDYPGQEMALTRTNVSVPTFPNLIMYRLSTTGLSNLVDLAPYSYSPPFTSISLGDVNGDRDDEVVMLRDPGRDTTALLLVNPVGAPMRDFQQNLGWPLVWSQVRTGDLDADGRAEIVVLRPDRYRIYWQAELDNYFQDFTGSFHTPSATALDRPTMAIANYDGQGIPGNGPMVVSPASLSVVRRPGAPPTVLQISITRAGASIGWQAWETTDLPGVSLSPSTGATPGTLNVTISENTLGRHQTTIRIQSTTPGVTNGDQVVPLTFWVTDRAIFLPLVLK